MFDTASRVLDLFEAGTGAPAGTFAVEPGSALNKGKAGPLGKKFNVELAVTNALAVGAEAERAAAPLLLQVTPCRRIVLFLFSCAAFYFFKGGTPLQRAHGRLALVVVLVVEHWPWPLP